MKHARVVIIGGGVVGASALYHLTRLGWTDVLLLDRNELSSGSTWHAAGNVPNFSTSWNVIKLQRYGSSLYRRLGEEVGYPIDYHVTGSIRLAHVEARMEEFRHVRSMARAQGIAFDMLSPGEIKARFPLIEPDGILGGLWDPYDGDIDPSQLTQAFVKGARDRGARLERFNRVTAIRRTPAGEWELTTGNTGNGTVTCEIVVNAAGYRAGEVAALVGQYLPAVTMQHQYLVTQAIPELALRKERLPLLRDPDVSYYMRQERDGLILGPYEWGCKPAWLDGIPEDFSFQLYPDDLDRLEPYIEAAVARVPALRSVGLRKVINGPIPYSPDGNPYIGPQHGLRNFFNCNTFSFGISQAGGAGKTLAEYVVHGEPEWDLWSFDHRRYTGYADPAYARDKAIELYRREYAIGFPNEERPAGRPRKTTPLHDRLKAKGAVFGARNGWERAAYFARSEGEKTERPSFHRAETSWFAAVAEECRAVSERVGIFDLAGFSKFTVTGPRGAQWLEAIICRKAPKLGRVVLAYALTERGSISSEFTVTRLAEDSFYLLAAGTAQWHDFDWLQSHLPQDDSVHLDDVTHSGSTLVLAGPRSRDVLQRLTSADLTNAAFPWSAGKEIEVAGRKLLALRINYIGELGWELHVPMADLAAVYDALFAAGEPFGIRDFGMYATESMRLEKAYRSWKQDMTIEYTPDEAGLGRFVDLSNTGFIGRAGLLARREAGMREVFVPLIIEAGSADAPICAIVFKDGERVGIVGSGGWGHRIGKSIALAYVRPDCAELGTRLEVDILGTRHRAFVAEEPIFDPANTRLKG
ncbi:MAG: FAD-dependent oxidoreductase [Hyphomicrobiales bacterium]